MDSMDFRASLQELTRCICADVQKVLSQHKASFVSQTQMRLFRTEMMNKMRLMEKRIELVKKNEKKSLLSRIIDTITKKKEKNGKLTLRVSPKLNVPRNTSSGRSKKVK